MKHACSLALALLLALPVLAQGPVPQPPIRLWPELVKFLELTPQQVLDLGRLEAEWQRFLAVKTRRVAQVEREIRDATLAETVDPLALGLRYAELEAICRECRDMDKRTMERARGLLTPAQLQRLASLEQAWRLLPVIAEADAAHLIEAPLAAANLVNSVLPSSRRYPGCRFDQPLPAPGPLAEGPGN